jgi:hypothetical protein
MTACPHCNGTGRVHAPFDLDAATRELEQRCRDRGLLVRFDQTVSDRVAALIVGRQKSTLRNWRSADGPLPFKRIGGRVCYHLADIAAFLQGQQ